MTSLDIAEPQFVLEFPADPNFTWHHRVALKRVGAGRWISLTPDLDYEVVTLEDANHRFV